MLVDFYHLARTPVERVLPTICEKVLASGEKLLVVAEADVLTQLDAQLWSYAPDAFLPHARSGAAQDEMQPILLTDEVEARNGATHVALADGRWREEALCFARIFYLFDNAQLDTARGSWRTLKDKPEVERRYWKQDERGKWVQGP
jgi:DNA polymerase-3 subunit chi